MRIFEYAKVADWDSRLQVLTEIAEPERWTFRCVPDASPLPVLDSYIRYTFLRVYEQAKIAESDRLSCFNTGLLTANQEEIFGVFRVSDLFDPRQPVGPGNKRWFLTSWARAGDRHLTEFLQLPDLATYWSDPAELVFNPNLQVQLNLDHIIRDDLNRFPTELGGHLDVNGIPTDLATFADIESDAGEPADGGTPAAAAPDVTVPLATRNALEGAMKHSVRLAQRSYRIAVPQHHQGRIQLLLPLYLRNADRPDLALTLERHGGWYRAATVLYPDWAYRHARLLSRPNSEWLGGFRGDVLEAG